MREKILWLTHSQLYALYMKELKPIVMLAQRSDNIDSFKESLRYYIYKRVTTAPTNRPQHQEAAQALIQLIDNDGLTLHELSTGADIELLTITHLYHFLSQKDTFLASTDMLIDLFEQFKRLTAHIQTPATETHVLRWMSKWPSGLEPNIISERLKNKERIIALLLLRIERHYGTNSKYKFPEDATYEQKMELLEKWWYSAPFQLAMAIKTPSQLNHYLADSLSQEQMRILNCAHQKGIPFFVTPYYASLICVNRSYDDTTIRSYVLYSLQLVHEYGNIRAWEKEDKVMPGKPNAAGWLLPEGGNMHRRYPDVVILIPDSMGRACGGLCASCQRLYDFQNEHLNFNLEQLKPKESWPKKLTNLMQYIEEDTQICDLLITGGDALMSQNSTLRHLLNEVLKMAAHKRKDNLTRAQGEKYAEIQRIRLGSRLPVYLPMRINAELIDILRQVKTEGQKIGIRQFIIQTHFQSPLEVTPEAQRAIMTLQSAGWMITNQLVFNVAASRRGHTAKLRHILNSLGVICYYTFTVKGFEENYALYAPNSRSVQEQHEEKCFGYFSPQHFQELKSIVNQNENTARLMRHFLKKYRLPFIATDRNVMNLPAIGKSMTFRTIAILANGKRLLEFQHDTSRQHSPIINQIGNVYIIENKSVAAYLRQLEEMGEDSNAYSSIWSYTNGNIDSRSPLFLYPESDYITTKHLSHYLTN